MWDDGGRVLRGGIGLWISSEVHLEYEIADAGIGNASCSIQTGLRARSGHG